MLLMQRYFLHFKTTDAREKLISLYPTLITFVL